MAENIDPGHALVVGAYAVGNLYHFQRDDRKLVEALGCVVGWLTGAADAFKRKEAFDTSIVSSRDLMIINLLARGRVTEARREATFSGNMRSKGSE